jgi:hypothetical protein
MNKNMTRTRRYVLCGTESTNIIRIQGPNLDILYEPT